MTELPHDPSWPRTGAWPPPPADPSTRADLTLVGVPTSGTSLSPTNAHVTPTAIRHALRRYSSHFTFPGGPAAGIVLDDELVLWDAGDVGLPHPDRDEPDAESEAGESAATAAIAALAHRSTLVCALGGDNSCTVPAAQGVFGTDIGRAGLITLDAHHDVRDGRNNGSPVRRLVEAGLDPSRIVQIGIADFANSKTYRERVRQWGVTVMHRDALDENPLRDIVAEALTVAGAGGGPIHLDIDLDVCDRSVVPACPAALPGGISAAQVRRLVRSFARDDRVRSVDIAEVDATADSADQRTVRLAALCVLEAAAGVKQRETSVQEGVAKIERS